MLKYFLIALLFMLSIHVNAQFKPCKTYLYIQNNLPGIVRQDENGKQERPAITTNVVIFFQVKNNQKLPAFASVTIQSKKYDIVMKEIKLTTAIGFKESNGQPVRLIPKKGFQLWQLETTVTELENYSQNQSLKLDLFTQAENKMPLFSFSKIPIKLSPEPRP
jgi:hypothetical protein